MICNVRGCDEDRARDAQVCRGHLWALWLNLLERLPDGTYAAPVADVPTVR